jgi:hypothetical protein
MSAHTQSFLFRALHGSSVVEEAEKEEVEEEA